MHKIDIVVVVTDGDNESCRCLIDYKRHLHEHDVCLYWMYGYSDVHCDMCAHVPYVYVVERGKALPDGDKQWSSR